MCVNECCGCYSVVLSQCADSKGKAYRTTTGAGADAPFKANEGLVVIHINFKLR